MNWTASVTDKNFVGGVLTVVVAFTNSKEAFNQDFDLTGGSLEMLSQKVSNRLTVLNSTEALAATVVNGPVAAFVAPVGDPLVIARSKLAFLKQDVDLGILPKTDPAYIAALSDAQSAFAAK